MDLSTTYLNLLLLLDNDASLIVGWSVKEHATEEKAPRTAQYVSSFPCRVVQNIPNRVKFDLASNPKNHRKSCN